MDTRISKKINPSQMMNAKEVKVSRMLTLVLIFILPMKTLTRLPGELYGEL